MQGRLANDEAPDDGSRFAAIWVKQSGPPFVARHGMTSQEYQQQFDQLVGQQGFCLVDVSGYAVGGQDRYAAIWEKKELSAICRPARHDIAAIPQQFDQLVGQQGFRLTLVDGYTVAGQDRYAAIWEKSPGPAFVARHGMTSQQYQQQFDQLVGQQGFCLLWSAAMQSAIRTAMPRYGKRNHARPLPRVTADIAAVSAGL